MCVVIPTDTNPTTWDVENGKNCDIIFHEVGPDPEIYARNLNVPVEAAQMIVDSSHTNPKALGKIFAETQPRLGVVTHTVENADTRVSLSSPGLSPFFSVSEIINLSHPRQCRLRGKPDITALTHTSAKDCSRCTITVCRDHWFLANPC